jgi:UDP-3-O-[3-hydroxymyristoyl] glucosamine N-acyltransferase
MSIRLGEIASVLNCSIKDEEKDIKINRIADAKNAEEDSITFVSDKSYEELAKTSKAAAVIVARGKTIPEKICLEVDDPYVGFAKVAQLFEDKLPLFDEKVHTTAIIHPTAEIHENVFIGPYSVIGKNCKICEGTIIGALCVVENGTQIGKYCRIDSGSIIRRNCKIGNRVIIQSGAIIGSEGFGNARENGKWIRIPSFGNVIIEDDVEIGACTTVDRGTFGPTVIEKGVKLDNLIMVAHNVSIGEDTAMAAQVGISGSTKIGKRVIVGGQAGFVGHINIEDDSFIGAQSGVAKSITKGSKITGAPARDFMTMRRIEAAQLYLPEMLKEVKRLKKEIEELKKELENLKENKKH